MAKTRTSFKKGEIHNPKGAPKRQWTWAGELEKAVQEAAKDGKSIKFHVARSLVAESLKGNVIAIKELMNRMDGMPSQDSTVNLDGNVIINMDELIGLHKAGNKTAGSSTDTTES